MTEVRARDECFFTLENDGEVPPPWVRLQSMDCIASFHFTNSSLCFPETVGGAISWFHHPPHISKFNSVVLIFYKIISLNMDVLQAIDVIQGNILYFHWTEQKIVPCFLTSEWPFSRISCYGDIFFMNTTYFTLSWVPLTNREYLSLRSLKRLSQSPNLWETPTFQYEEIQDVLHNAGNIQT